MIVVNDQYAEMLIRRLHRVSRVNINVGHLVIGKHFRSNHSVQVARLGR